MKIRPVGAELFYADRRTDGRTAMTKLIVAFNNFANSPKNGCICAGGFPAILNSKFSGDTGKYINFHIALRRPLYHFHYRGGALYTVPHFRTSLRQWRNEEGGLGGFKLP